MNEIMTIDNENLPIEERLKYAKRILGQVLDSRFEADKWSYDIGRFLNIGVDEQRAQWLEQMRVKRNNALRGIEP